MLMIIFSIEILPVIACSGPRHAIMLNRPVRPPKCDSYIWSSIHSVGCKHLLLEPPLTLVLSAVWGFVHSVIDHLVTEMRIWLSYWSSGEMFRVATFFPEPKSYLLQLWIRQVVSNKFCVTSTERILVFFTVTCFHRLLQTLTLIRNWNTLSVSESRTRVCHWTRSQTGSIHLLPYP
jgi:hypothetical protein